jgi:hypothetical protein
MDYGKLFSRAWEIVWKYKFLIILGILAALTGGFGSGASGSSGAAFEGDQPHFELDMPWGAGHQTLAPLWITVIVAMALVVGLTLWVVSTIARGGLVAGADAASREEPTSFGLAWRAGWERALTLLGIGLIPAVVSLIPIILAVLGWFAYTSNPTMQMGTPMARNVLILGSALACLIVPVAIAFEMLRALAERACMLEGLGVLASYGRAFRVVVDNLGSALVLLLLQVAVMVVAFILLIVPGIVLLLCCLFWPFILVLEGAVTAYFSTMWTLAWREWTGDVPAATIVPGGEVAS